MKRWAPLTGVAFVVLLVASFAVSGSTPDGNDSAQKVVSFYKDHDTKEIVSSLLGVYAVIFFVFFLGVLRTALRRDEPDGTLSAVAFGGGLILAVGGLVFSALTFTLADLADNLDPTATQAVNALNTDLFFLVAAGTAIFLIAAGILTVRGGALPTWLGWVAVVLGVLCVTPIGFFAFLASLIWVLIVSIVLAMREPAGSVAATPPAGGPATGAP
jgi:hypothetical protein